MQGISTTNLLVAGHSMGGHGAWHFATTIAGNVTALIPAAGWLVKEVGVRMCAMCV